MFDECMRHAMKVMGWLDPGAPAELAQSGDIDAKIAKQFFGERFEADGTERAAEQAGRDVDEAGRAAEAVPDRRDQLSQ